MEKKLTRTFNNKVIAGVCGGIGLYFAVDPVVVRILFILSLFVLGPLSFLAYLVLWVVVPYDKTPAVENQQTISAGNESVSPSSKNLSMAFSIIAAFALIMIGVFILIPGWVFRIWDVAIIGLAVFIFFIAGRIVLDMIADKNYTLVRVSVAAILATYAVFILLTRLNLIQSGIFLEYTKNLLPAVLIAAGIGLLLKGQNNKILIPVVGTALFLFVGVYSFVKGNYPAFGFMDKMVDGFRFHNKGNWGKSTTQITINNYSVSYPLPEGLDDVSYDIKNAAGSLVLADTESLFEYRGDGMTPSVSTNTKGSSAEVEFSNQASQTKLFIHKSLPVNLKCKLSAGNLEADLRALKVKSLSSEVNGGSAKYIFGEGTQELDIKNNVGSTEITLPKNATVRIKILSAMAHVGMPSGFEQKGGEFVYNGGKGSIINIDATVNMGNLEFKF